MYIRSNSKNFHAYFIKKKLHYHHTLKNTKKKVNEYHNKFVLLH